MMNKSLRMTVYIVMAAALALMVFSAINYIHIGKELRSCEVQLAESRTVWETTAAEKESLQADLKGKQNELSIARLELDSATEETEKIRAEIETLRSEIEALKQGK